jgi:hypothetical protein
VPYTHIWNDKQWFELLCVDHMGRNNGIQIANANFHYVFNLILYISMYACAHT